jgi:hypothetical protein
VKIANLSKEAQHRRRDEQQRERATANEFVEACASGDVDRFNAAAATLNDMVGGWTRAYRLLVKKGPAHVSQEIRDWFQIVWFDSRTASHCDDKRMLDALYILFTPYGGPAVRLFRGAVAHEARARTLCGASWTSDVEEADWFARDRQSAVNGAVVLETLVPREAIISAPGINGSHWLNDDGSRLYDEREYIVDTRRLQRKTIARRYPPISLEEWKARNDAEQHKQ